MRKNNDDSLLIDDVFEVDIVLKELKD